MYASLNKLSSKEATDISVSAASTDILAGDVWQTMK